MRFNINDEVMVRLTDEGRRRLKANHDNLFADWSRPPEYRAPEERKGGWSKWQLWVLMNEFGPHMRHGGDCFFETAIEIPVKRKRGRNGQ